MNQVNFFKKHLNDVTNKGGLLFLTASKAVVGTCLLLLLNLNQDLEKELLLNS